MKIFTVDKGTLVTGDEEKMRNPTEIISPTTTTSPSPIVVVERKMHHNEKAANIRLVWVLIIGLLLAAAITMAVYHWKMTHTRGHRYYHGDHWPQSAAFEHSHRPPHPPPPPPPPPPSPTTMPQAAQQAEVSPVLEKLTFLRQLLDKIRQQEQTMVDKDGMPLDGQMKFTMISVHPMDSDENVGRPFFGPEQQRPMIEDMFPVQIHPPPFMGMGMGGGPPFQDGPPPPPFWNGPQEFGPEPFPRILPAQMAGDNADDQQQQPMPVFRVRHHFENGNFNPRMVETEVFKGRQFARLAEKLFGIAPQDNNAVGQMPPPPPQNAMFGNGFPFQQQQLQQVDAGFGIPPMMPPQQQQQVRWSWEVDPNAPPLPPQFFHQQQQLPQQQQLQFAFQQPQFGFQQQQQQPQLPFGFQQQQQPQQQQFGFQQPQQQQFGFQQQQQQQPQQPFGFPQQQQQQFSNVIFPGLQQQQQQPIVPAEIYTRGQPFVNVDPFAQQQQQPFGFQAPVVGSPEFDMVADNPNNLGFGPDYNSNQQFQPPPPPPPPMPEQLDQVAVIDQPFMQQQPFYELPQEQFVMQEPEMQQQQQELVPRLQEIPPPPPMRQEEQVPNRVVHTDGSWEEIIQYQDPQIDEPIPEQFQIQQVQQQQQPGLDAILRPDVMLNLPQPRGPPAPVIEQLGRQPELDELNRGEGWMVNEKK